MKVELGRSTIHEKQNGVIGGFVLGLAGFLLMFKLIVLDRIPPADELAPGIVVMASILSGLLFAFAGHRIQNALGKKRNEK